MSASSQSDPSQPPIPHMLVGPKPLVTKRLINFLRRFWWLPVLTALVGGALQAFQIYQEPAQFDSKSSMVISGTLKVTDGAVYLEELRNFAGTQIEIMRSGLITQRAHNRVLASDEELTPTHVDLRVGRPRNSSVFTLQATSTNQFYPSQFLDALMQEYLNYREESRQTSVDDTTEATLTRMLTVEKELHQYETNLNEFRKEHNLVVLEESGNSAGAYLAKLNTQLADLKLAKDFIDELASNDAHAADSLKTSVPLSQATQISSIFDSGTVQEYVTAQQQLRLIEFEQDDLGRFLRPAHPKMIFLAERISRQTEIIDLLREQSRDELLSTKQTLDSHIGTVEETIIEWEEKVRANNTLMAEHNQLDAQYQRAKAAYDRLLNMVDSVNLNPNLDQEMVTILENASMPRSVQTGLTRKMGMAVALGIFAGLALLFLIERTNDKLTSLNDVNEWLSSDSVIGQIPEITFKGRTLSLLTKDDDRFMFSESYRNIRSSLRFMSNDQSTAAKTIVITSAVPNEGKSTIAANLALTIAFGGSKVLLVDADLKRGNLDKLFYRPNTPGFVEYLNQQADVDHVIYPTGEPNLQLLPAGEKIDGTGDLLLGPLTELFIKRVYPEYDYILFDSAPILATDDTSNLVPKVDGVIFVTRSNYSRGRMVKTALKHLQHRQANIIGLVFNAASSKTHGSYSYYYRYQDYYYNDGKKSKKRKRHDLTKSTSDDHAEVSEKPAAITPQNPALAAPNEAEKQNQTEKI